MRIYDPLRDKKIYVVYGPTGSGKTTIAEEFKAMGVPQLITSTKRKPRPGEVNGIHYYFLSDEEFDSTDFVEKTKYANKKYGTSRKEVEKKLKANNEVYIILDINGVNAFKELYGDKVVTIYTYCGFETIKQRLIERGTSEEELKRRLDAVINEGELTNIDKADYVIVTDKHSIDICRHQLKCIYFNSQLNEAKKRIDEGHIL